MTRETRFENDWTAEQLERTIKRFNKVVTIPIYAQIKDEHLVLHFNEARRILESANKIVLMDCTCRVQKGNCDAPVRTCLRLNERAVQAMGIDELKHLNPVEVTVDEAIKVLEASHRQGLIHLAIAVDQGEINEVCSCCECCCMALSAITRLKLAPHLLTSTVVISNDVLRCIRCGACVERCHFDALEILNELLIVHKDKCIGCGLCLSSCPTQALMLIDKYSSLT